MENVIIIGSGPAAYAAALRCEDLSPLMFEGTFVENIGPGGQLTTTTDVDNYPGFPNGIQGPNLMEIMREQALSRKIRIISENITSVTKVNDIFMLRTENEEYSSKSIVVATGASAKRLYVSGTHDNEFWQKGISACAVCDGFFFKDMVVAVIGGGDSAMEEALYLSNIAKKVFLIHRRHTFRARADKIAQLKSTKNIELIVPAELVSAHGDSFLKSLKLKNTETNEEFDLPVDGLFFGIGHNPNTKFLNGLVELDDVGYIKADCRGFTSVPGCFACGDVQDAIYRQAVTAAASGCISGKEVVSYIEAMRQKD